MSATSAPRSLAARAWQAVDERFHLAPLVDFLSHKEVPVAHSIVWYYLGGLSLFLFVVQIGTGILLLMNYQVGENTSYESMKVLVGRVPFGWLIRSIHCWSAHLMSLAVLGHLFSVLFVKAYRKPRELTWYSGFAMLGLVLGFGFSGYLLPWNELSYFATAVGTDSAEVRLSQLRKFAIASLIAGRLGSSPGSASKAANSGGSSTSKPLKCAS